MFPKTQSVTDNIAMKTMLPTNAIARKLNVELENMLNYLMKMGLIKEKSGSMCLTDAGISVGGMQEAGFHSVVILKWPAEELVQLVHMRKFITATIIKAHFQNISRNRINLVLSELGWMEKDHSHRSGRGWKITPLGRTVGGRQLWHVQTGIAYVAWPEIILYNISLIEAMNGVLPSTSGKQKKASEQESQKREVDEFRKKFPAQLRTKDGHYVRSKAELIIDNALYDYGLVHAYEKRVPVEEDLFTDFYLPFEKVYIEYWGLEDNADYFRRKQEKLTLYKKYNLNLIELTDEDVKNLDDYLPKKLLKFGVKVF